eukprot:2796584-Ditylum_brightwellii.AAC.1
MRCSNAFGSISLMCMGTSAGSDVVHGDNVDTGTVSSTVVFNILILHMGTSLVPPSPSVVPNTEARITSFCLLYFTVRPA